MFDETIDIVRERGRRRGRDVDYTSGAARRIVDRLPLFELKDFRAGHLSLASPHLQSVVRIPRCQMEWPIPVATVSMHYNLIQHRDAANTCMGVMVALGIHPDRLRCEAAQTELGEWVNLAFHFPEAFGFTPRDGHPMTVRLECSNSVDGSGKLAVMLSWYRAIGRTCFMMRNTQASFEKAHIRGFDMGMVGYAVHEMTAGIPELQRMLARWDEAPYDEQAFVNWVEGPLRHAWGERAAYRVYRICSNGFDIEREDPLAIDIEGASTEIGAGAVPGANAPASSLFDVSQALAWVASRITDPDTRLKWQSEVVDLVNELAGEAEH